jgi:hypothetical protein
MSGCGNDTVILVTRLLRLATGPNTIGKWMVKEGVKARDASG